MSTMTRTYAIYTRVSTGAQDENTSISRQVEACQRWGEANGWTFLEHIHDTVTGKSYDERAGVQRILGLVDSGRVTDVVCWSVDRTGREVTVIQRFFQDIYLRGGRVTIYSKSRTYNTFNEIRKDTVFDAAVADYERTTIVDRLQDGKMYAFKELNSFIFSAPYGYAIKSKRLEHGRQKVKVNYLESNPEEAELLNTILTTYVDTRSRMQTVRAVNANGFKTKRGGTFGHVQLNEMIERIDMYAGKPREETFQGVTRYSTYPALISEELADKVKETYAITPKTQDRSTVQILPFSNLITCACCGDKATGNKGWKPNIAGFGYMCRSIKRERNAYYAGKPLEHATQCKSQIALPRFIEKLTDFLSAVNTNDITSKFEAEMSKILADTKLIEMRLSDNLEGRNALKSKQADLVTATVKIAGNADFAELIGAVNEQLKGVQAELEAVNTDIDALNDTLSKKVRIFDSLGIPLSALPDYQLQPTQRTVDMPTLLDRTSAQAYVSEAVRVEERARDGAASQLHKEFIATEAKKVRQTLNQLQQEIAAENWLEVNRIMFRLGLCFTADFSDTNRKTRPESVRVLVDFEPLENLLAPNTVSLDYRQATLPKKGTY